VIWRGEEKGHKTKGGLTCGRLDQRCSLIGDILGRAQRGSGTDDREAAGALSREDQCC